MKLNKVILGPMSATQLPINPEYGLEVNSKQPENHHTGDALVC